MNKNIVANYKIFVNSNLLNIKYVFLIQHCKWVNTVEFISGVKYSVSLGNIAFRRQQLPSGRQYYTLLHWYTNNY